MIRFSVKVLGRSLAFKAVVTEPEPGRVLVERNVEPDDSVTTFTVEAGPDGTSEVTISTELPEKAGLFGAIERFVTRKVLDRLYGEELALLERAAQSLRP